MSKKYKGKTCSYCLKSDSSATADHVIAREFFPENERTAIDFPKVPSCTDCNNEKSKLEHHLITVLPFGIKGKYGLVHIEEKVKKCLEKNQKLHRELSSGKEKDSSGVMTIPIDAEKIIRLFMYIVKGLMWHHWNILLDEGYEIKIIFPSNHTEEYWEKCLLSGNQHVHKTLGNITHEKEALIYQGTQGKDYPQFSIWKFDVFGVKLADEQSTSSSIFAITAGSSFFQKPTIKPILS